MYVRRDEYEVYPTSALGPLVHYEGNVFFMYTRCKTFKGNLWVLLLVKFTGMFNLVLIQSRELGARKQRHPITAVWATDAVVSEREVAWVGGLADAPRETTNTYRFSTGGTIWLCTAARW